MVQIRLIFVLVDFKKAFYSVNRSFIIHKIAHDFDVRGSLLKLICILETDKVIVDHGFSKKEAYQTVASSPPDGLTDAITVHLTVT